MLQSLPDELSESQQQALALADRNKLAKLLTEALTNVNEGFAIEVCSRRPLGVLQHT